MKKRIQEEDSKKQTKTSRSGEGRSTTRLDQSDTDDVMPGVWEQQAVQSLRLKESEQPRVQGIAFFTAPARRGMMSGESSPGATFESYAMEWAAEAHLRGKPVLSILPACNMQVVRHLYRAGEVTEDDIKKWINRHQRKARKRKRDETAATDGAEGLGSRPSASGPCGAHGGVSECEIAGGTEGGRDRGVELFAMEWAATAHLSGKPVISILPPCSIAVVQHLYEAGEVTKEEFEKWVIRHEKKPLKKRKRNGSAPSAATDGAEGLGSDNGSRPSGPSASGDSGHSGPSECRMHLRKATAECHRGYALLSTQEDGDLTQLKGLQEGELTQLNGQEEGNVNEQETCLTTGLNLQESNDAVAWDQLFEDSETWAQLFGDFETERLSSALFDAESDKSESDNHSSEGDLSRDLTQPKGLEGDVQLKVAPTNQVTVLFEALSVSQASEVMNLMGQANGLADFQEQTAQEANVLSLEEGDLTQPKGLEGAVEGDLTQLKGEEEGDLTKLTGQEDSESESDIFQNFMDQDGFTYLKGLEPGDLEQLNDMDATNFGGGTVTIEEAQLARAIARKSSMGIRECMAILLAVPKVATLQIKKDGAFRLPGVCVIKRINKYITIASPSRRRPAATAMKRAYPFKTTNFDAESD